MGRTHDHYCYKCMIHWNPFDSSQGCPICESEKWSTYDPNGDHYIEHLKLAKETIRRNKLWL